MNRQHFFELLEEVETEYCRRKDREGNKAKHDDILLAVMKELKLPNLPFIRGAILNGGGTKTHMFVTMERAWRQYAQDLIRRVESTFNDFKGEGGIHPEKVAGFAERHNLSPAEAAWVMKFRKGELQWSLGLAKRLDGFLL